VDRQEQVEAVVGIEDRDELRQQPQIRVAIRRDQARRDGGGGSGHGGREVAEGAEIHFAFEAQLIERRVVPMRAALAADAQRQAGRKAQLGQGPANEDVARDRGNAVWEMGAVIGVTPQRAAGDLLPPVDPSRILSLPLPLGVPDRRSGTRPSDRHPPALPRQPMKLDGPS
jgi:hypothetical protein